MAMLFECKQRHLVVYIGGAVLNTPLLRPSLRQSELRVRQIPDEVQPVPLSRASARRRLVPSRSGGKAGSQRGESQTLA